MILKPKFYPSKSTQWELSRRQDVSTAEERCPCDARREAVEGLQSSLDPRRARSVQRQAACPRGSKPKALLVGAAPHILTRKRGLLLKIRNPAYASSQNMDIPEHTQARTLISPQTDGTRRVKSWVRLLSMSFNSSHTEIKIYSYISYDKY